VQVAIGDLSGDALGFTEGNTVTLDVDAAGYGWFVDLTPRDASEFRVRQEASVLSATPASEAFGSMDLLTVLTHELGHILGLDHDDAASFAVMTDSLSAGVRHGDGGVPHSVAPLQTLSGDPAGGRPRLDFGDWMWSGAAGPGAAGYATGFGASNGEATAVRTIDWGTNSTWNSLSPFQGQKPGKGGSQNTSDFLFRVR